ncbi:MAG: hypothetical protein HKM95_17895 [Inquilinus sp.]|nr:hypothetical protein [Inquilinus sp.]
MPFPFITNRSIARQLGEQAMWVQRAFAGGAAAIAGLTLATAAWAAGPHEAPIRQFADSTIRAWVSNPLVIDAIRDQNARHARLSQSDIDAMDRRWRNETSAANRPLINRTLENRLSQHLKDLKNNQHGIVTEVFIMDNRGLNVGQSNVTSDFWQGDEAKWKETYLVGPHAIMIDEIELDESTQTFQSQLNMSIIDPETGEVIGAITVGIDVEAII